MKEIIKLLRYIKGYWKDTILAWVCVLLESVAEGLVAYFPEVLPHEGDAGMRHLRHPVTHIAYDGHVFRYKQSLTGDSLKS